MRSRQLAVAGAGDRPSGREDRRTVVPVAVFQGVMASVSTTVSLVTSIHQGAPVGLTCSTLTSVAADPPTVLVSIVTTSRTCQGVLETGVIGVNVLRVDQEALARVFTARGIDRFRHGAWEPHCNPPRLQPDLVSAVLEGRLLESHPVADHTVLVCEVVDARRAEGGPLLYYERRYGRNCTHEPQEEIVT